MQRRDKKRIEAAKHARLMKRKPELREQLYGHGDRPPQASPNRATAKEDPNA